MFYNCRYLYGKKAFLKKMVTNIPFHSSTTGLTWTPSQPSLTIKLSLFNYSSKKAKFVGINCTVMLGLEVFPRNILLL